MPDDKSPQESETIAPQETGGGCVSHLVRLFPPPWSFDPSCQETPPERHSAWVFAADSTRICETRGADADALARLIVGAVNQYLPNSELPQPKKTDNHSGL